MSSIVKIVKIVILGNGGVGKSALTIQFVRQKFISDYDPTMQDSYRKEISINDKTYLVQISDTAGQVDLKSIRDSNILVGEGFMLVFDVTDTKTVFPSIETLRNQIYNIMELDHIPMVLVANKTDLKDQRVISTKQGMELAYKLGEIPYFDCSAKLSYNVNEAFITLISLVLKEYFTEEPTHHTHHRKKCIII